MKKVLVIGATGAMGSYLVPELVSLGYSVVGVSLDEKVSVHPNVRYVRGNAKDKEFLSALLSERYDGIVDFMGYGAREFLDYYELLLSRTDHYIFLSSCRVYDDKEVPVKESSPRLIDSSEDEELKEAREDYCISKAIEEDTLVASPFSNWTVVRPATTYSTMRLQLVTLEFNNTVGRALFGKKVVLPIEAKDKPATLSWGGDVAKMLARILFKEEAKREFYNVCSAEWRTWGEIAEYYRELAGLEAVWVDKEDYLAIIDPEKRKPYRWQLEYARLFRRITDNSKVLKLTGLKQEDMMPLYDGLKLEIANTPKSYTPPKVNNIGVRMDEYLLEHGYTKKTMKAMLVDGNKNLVWTDVDMPSPKSDEFLVRIHAAALNRADLLQREGKYPSPEGCPPWMGLEIAGEIVGAGDNALKLSDWRVGDKVCALLGGGGYAEYVAVKHDMLMPVPKGLSMVEAASLPEAYATSYLNLFIEGHLEEGKCAFIPAGASGLASVAIPMAKAFGARVITSVISEEIKEKIKHLGADVIINSSVESVEDVLRAEEEKGEPVFVSMDCLSGETLGKSLPYMARGGYWIVISTLAGTETNIPLRPLLTKGLHLVGSMLRNRTPEFKAYILSELVEKVWPKLESGQIKPSIYKVLPIERAEEAHAILVRGENIGKVVLTVIK